MDKLNNLLESIAKPLMPITPWLLRLGLGISFILHGAGKFPLPPERMVTWFESMGYMYPEIVTSLVALGEVGAGAGIILGGLLKNKVGDLVRKVAPWSEFQNKTGVVVDTMIAESGFIYRVHWGEDYGLFWQAPSQLKPFWVDK